MTGALTLTAPMRAMLMESDESDLSKATGGDYPSGHGVELRTPANYATARALTRRGLGDWEQGQWGMSGLYFNNRYGLQLRAALARSEGQ